MINLHRLYCKKGNFAMKRIMNQCFPLLDNVTFSYIQLWSRGFCSPKKNINNVLSDIEQGGTFDARKRVPKIITNELRKKIIDHSSSSSGGEYLFSSTRKRNMLKDSINKDTNAFTSSYNGARSTVDETQNFMNAFKTDVQAPGNVSFHNNDQRHTLSEFQKKSKDDKIFSTSRALSSKLKKLVGK